MTEPDNDILMYPIDYQAVLKHMKEDMKDDWFVDPLGYEDLFLDKDDLLDKLKGNLERGHGVYESGNRLLYDIPKTNFGLRYALETDFYDRFIYQSICSYLMPYIDPLLSNRVLSHRYNQYKNRSNEKYIFKNRIELWNTFEGLTYLGLYENKHLLVTDLLNYFEHISIENIKSSFLSLVPDIKVSGVEKNRIRSAIHTLTKLLEKWCYNNLHGLPQNRDPSSFIANVVLYSVDKEMANLGYDYYRYVDDIRIICKDEYESRRALKDLVINLRKLGLSINSKKTTLLNNQSENIQDIFGGSDERIIAIDNMWRSKNKKVISRSIPMLHEMIMELLTKKDTQSRSFRFCINRLKSLLSTNIFDSQAILAQEIVDKIIDNLQIQPSSTDQFCKLLADFDLSIEQYSKIELLLTNDSISIYTWQNYHLWILLSYKEYATEGLINKAIWNINNATLSAEVPACFIYLAATGNHSQLKSLLHLFDEKWPFQHQRALLIAAQKYSKLDLKPLVNKISPQIKGTTARLTNTNNKKYVSIINKSSLTEIYNDLNPYD